MKMAKANEADLEMALELSNALESLAGRWGGYMPEKIQRLEGDAESERFSLTDEEQCRRVLEYLIGLTRSASIFRVVMGMAVLLDPRNKAVDPALDYLELHPDAIAGMADTARMSWLETHAGVRWVAVQDDKPWRVNVANRPVTYHATLRQAVDVAMGPRERTEASHG